ncbi:MAG: amino acid adenylation domain-containing protein [Acidobacteriia bacterium]|nr:amino acid adenylation domain-containing protein [Terriglobia bacterium]
MNEQSNRLARRLAALDAGPGSITAIGLERTPGYLIALLAVLKSGAAFLPLDPRYPRARLDFMIQDSSARVLITNRRLMGKVQSDLPQTVLLEEPEVESEVRYTPAIPPSPDGLAYVAYTSGSTGKPKGVLCPQLGLLNRLEWMSNQFPYQPGEIACQIVALSFVDAIYEIFGPLLQGVELRIVPEQTARGSLSELMRAIGRNMITRIIVVPSVLTSWLDCIVSLNQSAFPLKYCFVSGEVLPASLATRFREVLPNTRLINFYGSSELCHHATWFEIADIKGKTVPIGRPIAATEAYVLDARGQPVLNGTPGELYMGGPGMARGYLNRPELTLERFVENPFGPAGTRLFKTGDLCRRLEDGNLEYLGRIDQQVKIRGCLVEPAEVEAALKSHPGIKEVLAGAREDSAGEKRLVAWVILRQQGVLTAADLRHFLEASVPPHLVPSRFMFLTNFPRLPNNKVNRRELPSPFDIQSGRRTSDSTPREGAERRLADIWEVLLKGGAVDRDDDFFDLGGDSLQAARLITMIEERFGVAIPMHSLLESPTVAQLALAIEEQRSSIYPRHIVPIQPFGSRARLFCFGAGPALKPLSRQLGADQPVFGIALDQRDLSWLDRRTPLEEVVRQMLPRLREFQPVGPYYLGGYSMHGLFAYEAALQLRAQGQQVAALILMDSYLPRRIRDRCPLWMRVGSQLASLGQRVARGDLRSVLRQMPSLVPLGRAYVRRKFRKAKPFAGSTDTHSEPTLAGLLSAAEAAYMPGAYRGRITLMEARDQLLGGPAGARFGWQHLSGGQVEIRSIPGDHNTMLLRPNVDHLAREIAACLERAQAANDGLEPFADRRAL